MVKRGVLRLDGLTRAVNQSQTWLSLDHTNARYGCLAALCCCLYRLASCWRRSESQFVVVTA